MATAQPQLNIMLWNLNGDANVSAKERLNDIDHVLDMVLENHRDNLFIFCQDHVNGPKHKQLSKRLHVSCPESKGHTHSESRSESKNATDSKRRSQVRDLEHFHKNEEASIYFRCLNKVTYVSNLHQTYEKIRTQVGSDFTYTRMQAYVVDGHALLVSWHGPYRQYTVHRRLDCFDSLVRFVERVRTENKCDVTIVGGDFNIPVRSLQQHVSEITMMHRGRDWADFPDLDVFCGYVPPPDRSDVIDYVVAWPKGRMKTCREEVVCKTYKRTPGNRPFDHPIVMYTLQNLEPKPIEHIKKESEVVMGPQNYMPETPSVRKGRNKKDNVIENVKFEEENDDCKDADNSDEEINWMTNFISKDIIHKESNQIDRGEKKGATNTNRRSICKEENLLAVIKDLDLDVTREISVLLRGAKDSKDKGKEENLLAVIKDLDLEVTREMSVLLRGAKDSKDKGKEENLLAVIKDLDLDVTREMSALLRGARGSNKDSKKRQIKGKE